MSLVSVIIPAYNGEAYLKQAIISVFEQTYPHYELIVINDGSSDRSKLRIFQPVVKIINRLKIKQILS